jgi:hypothetical protein
MGAVAFEAKPPFKPVLYTQFPILEGSQNDAWANRKPLVVFPGGAVCKDGMWTIVYGINDLKSGWLKLPHEELIKLCIPVPEKYPPMMELEETHRSQDGRNLDETKKTDEEQRYDVTTRDPALVDIAIREAQAVLYDEETKANILKAIIASPILNGKTLASGHGETGRSVPESARLSTTDSSSNPASQSTDKKEKLRANAAKARAALAEKRKQKNLQIK